MDRNTTTNALPIRCTAENGAAISLALASVESGRGQNHLGLAGVLNGAKRAEAALDKLGLAKLARRGAVYVFAEGGADCSSYRSAIPTTEAVYVRDARGWKLHGLRPIRQFPKARIVRDVVLTPIQADKLAEDRKGKRSFICRNGSEPKANPLNGSLLGILKTVPGMPEATASESEAKAA